MSKLRVGLAIAFLLLSAGNVLAMHKQWASDISASHVHNADGSLTYVRGH